jgi:maleamate amidohydrolase
MPSDIEGAAVAGWNDYLDAETRATYDRAGFGGRVGLGARPAVLVIDVNYAFCGESSGEDVVAAEERWPYSCGAWAWRAVPHIATLLDAARSRGVPTIYTTGSPPRADAFDRGLWRDKCRHDAIGMADPRSQDIVAEVRPRGSDIVLAKGKSSAFFGTELLSHLLALRVDSLLVCGTTTSGCVRATVTDAFSYNFRTTVVEECTFDRAPASHWVNLFELDQKYADVVPLASVCDYISSLDDGLFAGAFT